MFNFKKRLITGFTHFFLPALLVAAAAAPGSSAGDAGELPDGIEAVALMFDFEGSSAVPLRQNYYLDYDKPEWMKDIRSNPALFKSGEQGVRICAWFEAPPHIESALVWALLRPADRENPIRGVVEPETVTFTEGRADSVMFSISRPLPDRLGIYDFYLQWMAGDIPGMEKPDTALNISGPHRLYTVLDDPSPPWSVLPGTFSNPWSEALDLVLVGEGIPAVQKESLQTYVTKSVFEYPVFEYDIWGGASEYTWTNNYDYWTVDLTSMIDDIRQAITRVGNCYDGAAAVVVFSNLLGCDLKFLGSGGSLFWGFTRHAFGYLNCIDPIGRGEDFCNNPFHEGWSARDDAVVYQDGTSGSCSRTSFGNHAFAGPSGGADAIIWDATLKADTDGNRDTYVLFPSPDGDAVSTGLTSTVLTDESQNWAPGEFAGKLLNPDTDSKSPEPYPEYEILDNTATTITVVSGDLTDYAAVNDHYWVRDADQPSVDMTYVTGVPWSLYRPGVVDDIPSSNTDPPVECTLAIRSPAYGTGDIPRPLLEAYGVEGWPVGGTRFDVHPDPVSLFPFLENSRSISREFFIDGEHLSERYYLLESEKGTFRLSIVRGGSSEAVAGYLAIRLCGPRTMAFQPPPALPFGEVRCTGPGDVCFSVRSSGESEFGRIEFLRGNILVRLEGEGVWRTGLYEMACRLDRRLLSTR